MKTLEKIELDQLAERARASFQRATRNLFEGCNCILEAKEKCGDRLAWQAWCRDELGFSSRSAYRYARLADVNRGCLAIGCNLADGCGCDLTKAEELCKIPTIPMIRDFVQVTRISPMNREELRTAVRKYLCKLCIIKKDEFHPDNNHIRLTAKRAVVDALRKYLDTYRKHGISDDDIRRELVELINLHGLKL